jgi:hypothetical protein
MLASAGPSLLQSTVVAALVAGAVSLSALWVAGRRARQDRQRQLFAAAFEACIAYREFPYIVRRRRGDDAAAERVRISGELSEVQRRLESYKAMIRVEAPSVSGSYSALVAETRRIAGPQISAGWDQPPAETDDGVHVADVNVDGLEPFDDRFLEAVGDHLGLLPAWLRRGARRVMSRASNNRPRT